MEWISLNVGGTIFCTTLTTLRNEDSMLSRMFDNYEKSEDQSRSSLMPSVKDQNGCFLIDRSPKYFDPILNYLRTGKLIIDPNINPDGVYEEAKYYGISSLLETQIELPEENSTSLTRQEVIKAIVSTEFKAELRFQGVDLQGADLSMLDLRNINFKYARMQKCNLSKCNLQGANLERADLSDVRLDGAILMGVKMMCANLERASLQRCNAEDPTGAIAVLEGVNLRNANLQGSNLNGVNLRVANLKGADAQNCDLRRSCLAGADLELCNLSGSDLNEANLRGANFTNTVLESMLSPLHMSQTIR